MAAELRDGPPVPLLQVAHQVRGKILDLDVEPPSPAQTRLIAVSVGKITDCSTPFDARPMRGFAHSQPP
jgi:hypothetical protein